jgi:tRNA threonylcarbamoyladenosine biosynthesis protein TsaE
MELNNIEYSIDNIQDCAKQLLCYLEDYNYLVFSGQLGAGKTTLISAICKELGIYDVNSPSYTLQNIYKGKLSSNKNVIIEHWDLYRLNSFPDELLEVSKDTKYLLEWGEKFKSDFFKIKVLSIEIEIIGTSTRRIKISQWE